MLKEKNVHKHLKGGYFAQTVMMLEKVVHYSLTGVIHPSMHLSLCLFCRFGNPINTEQRHAWQWQEWGREQFQKLFIYFRNQGVDMFDYFPQMFSFHKCLLQQHTKVPMAPDLVISQLQYFSAAVLNASLEAMCIME